MSNGVYEPPALRDSEKCPACTHLGADHVREDEHVKEPEGCRGFVQRMNADPRCGCHRKRAPAE